MIKIRRIKKGDTIFVHAPANTGADLPERLIEIGISQIEAIGFKVRLSNNINKRGKFGVATIKERLSDLEDGLHDADVSLLMPVFGGYNSNQLLDYIDFDLIKKEEKTIIGYSDITALLNGIYAKTGIKMLHGISFASFCDPNIFCESINSFLQVINGEKNIELHCPDWYADDLWYLKEDFGPREKRKHPGWWIIREGESTGRLAGGNLDTLLALSGTPFFPEMDEKILLVESGFDENPRKFIRLFTQLSQLGILKSIKGVIIGQFAHNSILANEDTLKDILSDFLTGTNYPVIANVNLSHTDPIYTIPIGGLVKVNASGIPNIIILDSLYE